MEITGKIDMVEQAKAAIEAVDSTILDFQKKMLAVLCRQPRDLQIMERPLVVDGREYGMIFTSNAPKNEQKDIVAFNFPGEGGRWDRYRFGSDPEGYSGTRLQSGMEVAVASGWGYWAGETDAKMAALKRDASVHKDRIDDVCAVVAATGAKRVYLSGRSYGAFVVLAAVPHVQKMGVEVAALELKVPVISTFDIPYEEYLSCPSDELWDDIEKGLISFKPGEIYPELIAPLREGNIPTLIIRGKEDIVPYAFTDNLYALVTGPKALVSLVGWIEGRKRRKIFDHDLELPPVRAAVAASSIAFSESIFPDLN